MKKNDFLSLLPPHSDRPLIGIPLMFTSLEEEEEELQALSWEAPDFAEWRLDAFDPKGGAPVKALEKARDLLHYAFPSLPVLVTLRTKSQGGAFEKSSEEAAAYLASHIKTLRPSLLDVELSGNAENRKLLIQEAQARGIAVIESFHKTDSPLTLEEIESLISKFHDDRGDFIKLASYPGNAGEANRLLLLLTSVREKHPDLPLIFIAMGPHGRFLRCGNRQLIGPVSFASSLRPSAAGQIPYRKMKSIFSALYGK